MSVTSPNSLSKVTSYSFDSTIFYRHLLDITPVSNVVIFSFYFLQISLYTHIRFRRTQYTPFIWILQSLPADSITKIGCTIVAKSWGIRHSHSPLTLLSRCTYISETNREISKSNILNIVKECLL